VVHAYGNLAERRHHAERRCGTSLRGISRQNVPQSHLQANAGRLIFEVSFAQSRLVPEPKRKLRTRLAIYQHRSQSTPTRSSFLAGTRANAIDNPRGNFELIFVVVSPTASSLGAICKDSMTVVRKPPGFIRPSGVFSKHQYIPAVGFPTSAENAHTESSLVQCMHIIDLDVCICHKIFGS